MNVEKYLKKLWYKIVYLVIANVYIHSLGNLNEELLRQNFSTPFELLEYKNCIAVKYFVVAIALFIIGCCLVYHEIKKMQREYEYIDDMIIAVVTIALVAVTLLNIFVAINNPILRAILACIIVVYVGIEMLGN
jgi:hypothetical protein